MLGALPFRKYHKIKSMVHRITSKNEAPPKATLLRHRKDIEEKNDGNILKKKEQASKRSRSCRGMTPFSQLLSVHGDRHSGSESSWKRQQNQSVIHHSDVVTDEHQRPTNVPQVFLAPDSGPTHDARGRQDDQVKQRNSHPSQGPTLLPFWIWIWRLFFVPAFANQLFDFG